MYLKESSLSDCLKVSSMLLVFKNSGESCTVRNYCPVSLLPTISQILEKLVNNSLVDHLEKWGLASDF